MARDSRTRRIRKSTNRGGDDGLEGAICNVGGVVAEATAGSHRRCCTRSTPQVGPSVRKRSAIRCPQSAAAVYGVATRPGCATFLPRRVLRLDVSERAVPFACKPMREPNRTEGGGNIQLAAVAAMLTGSKHAITLLRRPKISTERGIRSLLDRYHTACTLRTAQGGE